MLPAGGWAVTAGGWAVTASSWAVTASSWAVTASSWAVTASSWAVTASSWAVTASSWAVTAGGWAVTAGLGGGPSGGCRSRKHKLASISGHQYSPIAAVVAWHSSTLTVSASGHRSERPAQCSSILLNDYGQAAGAHVPINPRKWPGPHNREAMESAASHSRVFPFWYEGQP